jgi:hypothetical protein
MVPFLDCGEGKREERGPQAYKKEMGNLLLIYLLSFLIRIINSYNRHTRKGNRVLTSDPWSCVSVVAVYHNCPGFPASPGRIGFYATT